MAQCPLAWASVRECPLSEYVGNGSPWWPRGGDVELALRVVEREHRVLEESVAEVAERVGRVPLRSGQEDSGGRTEVDVSQHERVDHSFLRLYVASRTGGCPRRRT